MEHLTAAIIGFLGAVLGGLMAPFFTVSWARRTRLREAYSEFLAMAFEIRREAAEKAAYGRMGISRPASRVRSRSTRRGIWVRFAISYTNVRLEETSQGCLEKIAMVDKLLGDYYGAAKIQPQSSADESAAFSAKGKALTLALDSLVFSVRERLQRLLPTISD